MNRRASCQIPQYVLLTGATGMVGAQILARLLRNQHPVAVLARARRGGRMGQGTQGAAQRIEEIVRRFEGNFGQKLKRPVVIAGDINEPHLGIQPTERRWLRERCGQVIHSAASLSFQPASQSSENEPYRTNLHGTESLVSLCKNLGIEDIHYISTAYVCGEREGNVTEVELDCGQSFSNDYERSKLQAETLLRSCDEAKALTIYRPSIVIDSTGLSPVSQDRTIYGAYSMFNALANKFGLPAHGEWFRNLGLAGEHRKNLVEASWVAETMVGIFGEESLHGQTYHLTSRQGTSIEQMEDAFRALTIETMASKSHGEDALNRKPTTPLHPFCAETLTPQQKSMLDAIAAPFVETFLPYFRDDPKFGRRNIDAALQRLALPEQPEVTEATLVQMIRLGKNTTPGVQRRSCAPIEIRQTAAIGFDLLDSDEGPQTQVTDDSWGIILCGPGGCDVELVPSRSFALVQGGEGCPRRLYLSMDDFNSLLDGSETVRSLVAVGRLSIECDAQERMTKDCDLLEDADALIQMLRDQQQALVKVVGLRDAEPSRSIDARLDSESAR